MLFVVLLFSAGDLQAVGPAGGGKASGGGKTTVKVGKVATPPEIPLPAECHEDTCKSAGFTAINSDCHRLICGNNFWGDWVMDYYPTGEEKTYGTGDDQIKFKTSRVRFPKREYSSDPWVEIQLQSEGPPFHICGTYLQGSPLTMGELKTPLDYLIPSAFAVPATIIIGERPSFSRPWSQEERNLVADLVYQQAIHRQENWTRVHHPGELSLLEEVNPEVATYVKIGLEASFWLAHELNPASYPCPENMDTLCGTLGDVPFQITWEGNLTIQLGNSPVTIFGATGALNIVQINNEFNISENPANLPFVAEIAVHETTHILVSFQSGNYDPATLTSELQPSVEGYINESTAGIVGAWFYAGIDTRSFMPYDIIPAEDGSSHIYEHFPSSDAAAIDNYENSVWREALDNPSAARVHVVPPVLGAVFASDLITPDPLSWLLEHLGFRWRTWDEFWQDPAHVASLYQHFERSILAGGGIHTLMGPLAQNYVTYPRGNIERTGAVMSGAPHPSLVHDFMHSPLLNPPGAPSGGTIGLPPPGSTFTNPGNIGANENDPNWSEPNRSNVVPTPAPPPPSGTSSSGGGGGGSGGGGGGSGGGGGGSGGGGGGGGGGGTGGGGGFAIGYNPDVDGDGIPNSSDSDMDNDGIPNGSDPDNDNDGIPNDQDYVPGPAPFVPGSTREECVLVDANGIETCIGPCECDINNPWWCRAPSSGSYSIHTCPSDMWTPPPGGDNRAFCTLTQTHFEEWTNSGTTLRCGTRGYCGGQWVWTIEDASLCQGNWFTEDQDMVLTSSGGCFPYVGPVLCYDGPISGPSDLHCFPNGTNQACGNFCGCPSDPNLSYVGCCNPFYFNADWPVGDIYECQFSGGTCYCADLLIGCLPGG